MRIDLKSARPHCAPRGRLSLYAACHLGASRAFRCSFPSKTLIHHVSPIPPIQKSIFRPANPEKNPNSFSRNKIMPGMNPESTRNEPGISRNYPENSRNNPNSSRKFRPLPRFVQSATSFVPLRQPPPALTATPCRRILPNRGAFRSASAGEWLRVRRGSDGDPSNLLQVMLAKGTPFRLPGVFTDL
jgi:hypothetical protein